ncbi:hypothetical protein [uncultured Kordia sp.]|uniref:hypothetical protein n=1 Tax=uncultured Kordia sp. TaxID=507699 RepID=UPI0026241912|nr:hypothetical protein [uncultured Kordia sp.]
MNTFRGFLILVALICGIASAYFGSLKINEKVNQIVANPSPAISENISYYTTSSYVTTHSGMNGGAIGLGLISGMSLIAVAITYIGREEK